MKQEIQAAITAALAPARPAQTMTEQLLDAAKKAQGIPSNYRLARVLGVSDNTMAKWSQGRNAPGEPHAMRLAEMAGMDAGVVVAELHAERAADPETRDLWRGIAARLRQVGLASILGVICSFGAPPEARAYAVHSAAQQDSDCALCQLTNARRRRFACRSTQT
jgi:DNA-binding transcriptional regulator YiaG